MFVVAFVTEYLKTSIEPYVQIRISMLKLDINVSHKRKYLIHSSVT